MGKLDGMIYAILCIICVAALIIGVWRLVSMWSQARKEKKPVKNGQSSYVQLNAAANQASNENRTTDGYKTWNGFLIKLDVERQNRHMPGRNAYEIARSNGNVRSVIFRDTNSLQKLLEQKAGSGEFIGTNKEKVDFGQTIGQYVAVDNRTKLETRIGIIHYTSEGAYIVPARPYNGGDFI